MWRLCLNDVNIINDDENLFLKDAILYCINENNINENK